MKKNLSILLTVLLAGCAGSANHKVVKTDPAADQALSCTQAEAEISRAQSIINDVNDDKSDVSGADVMDGLLYFPFNLIAKNSNYNNAMTAANQRIISLKEHKRNIGCEDDSFIQADVSDSLGSKLTELDRMYESNLLTDDEYKRMRLKLLGLE